MPDELTDIIRKWDQLMNQADGHPQANMDAFAEVRKRLNQLILILNWINEKAQSLAESDSLSLIRERKSKELTKPMISGMEKLLHEIELHTETFYYIAHRIRKILQQTKPVLIPHMSSFECVGVRNVRNHLLEHAEIDLLSNGFSVGGEGGIVLKPSVSKDEGLLLNAKEFWDNLERTIQKASGSFANDGFPPRQR